MANGKKRRTTQKDVRRKRKLDKRRRVREYFSRLIRKMGPDYMNILILIRLQQQ